MRLRGIWCCTGYFVQKVNVEHLKTLNHDLTVIFSSILKVTFLSTFISEENPLTRSVIRMLFFFVGKPRLLQKRVNTEDISNYPELDLTLKENPY